MTVIRWMGWALIVVLIVLRFFGSFLARVPKYGGPGGSDEVAQVFAGGVLLYVIAAWSFGWWPWPFTP
jgi:hypothetical protein